VKIPGRPVEGVLDPIGLQRECPGTGSSTLQLILHFFGDVRLEHDFHWEVGVTVKIVSTCPAGGILYLTAVYRYHTKSMADQQKGIGRPHRNAALRLCWGEALAVVSDPTSDRFHGDACRRGCVWLIQKAE
jgi:hypothetical protein